MAVRLIGLLRVTLFALLVAGAIIALRPSAGAPPQPPPQRAADQTGGAALTALMILTIPFLVALFVLALRTRSARPDTADATWTRSTTRGLLFCLALMLALIAAVALTARVLDRPPPRSRRPPSATAADTPPDQDRPDQAGGGVDFDILTLFVVAALVVLLVSVWLAHRREADDDSVAGGAPPPAVPALAEAARRALAAVDDPALAPREAIISCYAHWEDALTDTPSARPRPFDTPTEILRRAADAGIVRRAHGRRLVALFEEARYSTHPMSEADRADAASALRLVLDDLEGAAWSH